MNAESYFSMRKMRNERSLRVMSNLGTFSKRDSKIGEKSKMVNQFNSSLSQSAVQKWRSNQIVKQKIKLKITFTMTNGTGHRQNWAGEAIIIRRSDVEHVHDYARQNAYPRDFLIIHIPMKIGLRNSEIRTLKIENIDFENHSFKVLDSKKYELFPLPLDMLSLELIQQLIGERQEGYVFTHQGSWTNVKRDEPLSSVEIWQITHDIALKAGVKGFNPRILRHYFAAHWIFDLKGNIVVLQRILRHKNLTVTTIYVSKLSFFEDIQKAYEGIQNSPLVLKEPSETGCDMSQKASSSMPIGEQRRLLGSGTTICDGCGYVGFCKFAPLPQCASECRFKQTKEEELKKIG